MSESIEKGLTRLARAKAIEDAIKYFEYINKNYSLTLRKSPKDIIAVAKIFEEFIEGD